VRCRSDPPTRGRWSVRPVPQRMPHGAAGEESAGGDTAAAAPSDGGSGASSWRRRRRAARGRLPARAVRAASAALRCTAASDAAQQRLHAMLHMQQRLHAMPHLLDALLSLLPCVLKATKCRIRGPRVARARHLRPLLSCALRLSPLLLQRQFQATGVPLPQPLRFAATEAAPPPWPNASFEFNEY
jgi:hypothetical protein